MDWRRSLAQSMRGLPKDVLEKIQADDAFRTALAGSDLEHVVAATRHQQQIAEDELDTFREQWSKLERLSRRLGRYDRASTVEDFEELIRWGDFPSTPRDVLSELVWFLGEVEEMSRVLSHLRYLADEAKRLLDIQQTDQQPQPQRRRAPRNEWRL